uniref:5-oxoprolinase (ATP-hydrolysing) n=1 Tax=Candidatus Kentrum sp. DK TaxID=2126562 RepID=A0A450SE71_9GAMM|nr:MAG: 5-oxoprolinase (ATP-hydrolysing) [Candidatus Kentron sp. DK]
MTSDPNNRPRTPSDTPGRAGRGWQFWIDRGGTFTDIVARTPTGHLITHKLLSENPERYPDAVTQGIGDVLRGAAGHRDREHTLPEIKIDAIRMGTTVATNALLERTGEPVVLAITEGFEDALRIGYQDRPDLFAHEVLLPSLLYQRVIAVRERRDASGAILIPPDPEAVRQDLRAAFDAGFRAIAIVFMHGYRYPEHERMVAGLARAVGFTQISVSHRVSPLVKLISRGDTTVVDAYLSPVLRRYLEGVSARLGRLPLSPSGGASEPRILMMQSSGGLTDARRFRGRDSILSGPAGGVVGAVATAREAGFDRIIAFDMGGTSTDVSHYAGTFERAFDTRVANVRLRVPILRIHTIAAGGGSVLHFRDGRYRVGPDSAGANPGPACYRRGGPLTITDCNVMTGRIDPRFFPAVFGPAGNWPIDKAVVHRRFAALAREIGAATGQAPPPEAVAAGFLRIAVENMANAVRKISVERGYDVSDGYCLCAFGAAGGQHACPVADTLGMEKILIHAHSGVLSAHGMGLADVRASRESSLDAPLTDALLPRLEAVFDALARSARAEIAAQGFEPERVLLRRTAHIKYAGTDAPLPIPLSSSPIPGAAGLIGQFQAAHRKAYGFLMPDRDYVVEMVSLEAIGQDFGLPDAVAPLKLPHEAEAPAPAPPERPLPAPLTEVALYAGGEWVPAWVYQRDALAPGCQVPGPAIVVEANATTVIEPGWRAAVTRERNLLLTRSADESVSCPENPRQDARETYRGHGPLLPHGVDRVGAAHARDNPTMPEESENNSKAPDPVLLEIFNNLFMSIAEQMGAALVNTAWSVNIKERLDFSCALFDGRGHLVANAPHIPVHLGSMGESVQAILRARGESLGPGDVLALNNPYNGGTHLPDITVITPVFAAQLTDGESGSGSRGGRGQGADQGMDQGMDQGADQDAEEGGSILFFVASRGHHADVGGITPGSMPPDSRHIREEGILIDDFLLVDRGRFREAALRALLASGPYPARSPDRNVADLKAQIAANEKGVAEIRRMARHYGVMTVRRYMGHVQDNAEVAVGRVLAGLRGGSFGCEFDNGARVAVAITVDRVQRKALIDFTGTSRQQPGNLNAPLAVCRAAVLYVFRTLVAEPIPLNEGCLRPLTIRVPEGTLLNPKYPAAVVAGNVEVAQCVTDTLFGALGIMAASQGTMNNFTFGNRQYQYYETLCGGTGAGPGARGEGYHGTDAVHAHMTNSRLTDPEILEQRFPVLLERFAIRKGSGGGGRFRGGDGVVRRIRFLEPMTAAILSERRRVPPFGIAGGKPGKTGRNYVARVDGSHEELAGTGEVRMEAEDVFVIETPGGGGAGSG